MSENPRSEDPRACLEVGAACLAQRLLFRSPIHEIPMSPCHDPPSCPLELSDGVRAGNPPHPRVEGFVNGLGPVRFLVDPGSPWTLLSPATARRLGLAPRSSVIRRDTDGVHQIALVPEVRVRLGGAQERVLTPGISPELRRLESDGLPQADGILGHDYLAAFGVRFDFPGRRLTLSPGGWENDGNNAAQPFELGPPRKPMILLPVRINGCSPMTFGLDPGSPATLLAPHCAALCGVDNSVGGGGAALGTEGAVPIWFGRIRELKAAGWIRENLTVAIGPFSNPLGDRIGRRLDGLLGLDVLRDSLLEIDYPRQVLRWTLPAPC